MITLQLKVLKYRAISYLKEEKPLHTYMIEFLRKFLTKRKEKYCHPVNSYYFYHSGRTSVEILKPITKPSLSITVMQVSEALENSKCSFFPSYSRYLPKLLSYTPLISNLLVSCWHYRNSLVTIFAIILFGSFPENYYFQMIQNDFELNAKTIFRTKYSKSLVILNHFSETIKCNLR